MNRRIQRIRAVAVAAAAVVGLTATSCPRRAASTVQPVSGDVAGTWLHRELPMRYMEAMTLRVRGDSVLGEGRYSMEAGRQGNTTIVGKIHGHDNGEVTLDILRDTGIRERWRGTVHGDTLRGSLTIADAGAQAFNFVRQP